MKRRCIMKVVVNQDACIGCGACARVCEYEAITIENNLAHIDPEKCVGCKKCRTACPRGVIK